MGVKYKTSKNKFPEMQKSLETINGRTIEIGCIEGDHTWLASIHEYGCTIRPKKAKYLTVPCNSKAAGKKASDFSDLFFLQLDDGSKWLVRNKGKDQLEFMFALMTSVTIPERSFLRSGHDKNIDEVMIQASRAVRQLLDGKLSEQQFLDLIGRNLSTKIKEYARSLSQPPNSPLTKEVKGSSNPLVDTGEMIEGITWRCI